MKDLSGLRLWAMMAEDKGVRRRGPTHQGLDHQDLPGRAAASVRANRNVSVQTVFPDVPDRNQG